MQINAISVLQSLLLRSAQLCRLMTRVTRQNEGFPKMSCPLEDLAVSAVGPSVLVPKHCV